MIISGKTKAVSLPLQFHAVRENHRGFPEIDETGVRELELAASTITQGSEDHTGPVKDLFRAINEDREPDVNGLEGRRIIELITAIYKSSKRSRFFLLRFHIPVIFHFPGEKWAEKG